MMLLKNNIKINYLIFNDIKFNYKSQFTQVNKNQSESILKKTLQFLTEILVKVPCYLPKIHEFALGSWWLKKGLFQNRLLPGDQVRGLPSGH